jgi:hypothetical protein
MSVTTLMAVIGCSHTVSGTARRIAHDDAPSQRGYGYANNRCGLLDDTAVKQVVGANHLVRPYTGTVCQYVLTRASTFIDVTYSWFEAGTLERERGIAQSNRAQISDVVIHSHQAFVARRSTTGDACSATAATNPGVASWWVQIRGGSPADPCQVAQTLLAKTLAGDS